jgi:Icc-related predicted phosphoesterase
MKFVHLKEIRLIVNYCSDLHLERNVGISIKNRNKADLLILAGDIVPIKLLIQSSNNLKKYDEWDNITEFFDTASTQYKDVIYVCGNHEFYDSDIDDVKALKKSLKQYNNIHVLEQESIRIDGHLFVGGTCWTKIKDPTLEAEALHKFSDYIYISDGKITEYYTNKRKQLLPSTTSKMCDDFIKYVNQTLEENDNNNLIVITHHCPTQLGIPNIFKGNFWNGLFCNEFDDYIYDTNRISHWIYGHTHDYPKDFYIGSTNILSNTHGYPNEGFPLTFEMKTFTL